MLIGIVSGLFAQQLTYQAVVRDNNQQLVVNTSVRTYITINFTTGSPYKDTVDATTNLHGLLTFEFGDETLEGRNWKDATLTTTVVNRANTGVVYVNNLTRPVSAVPYALGVNGQSIQNYLASHNYIDSSGIHGALRDTAASLRTLIRNIGGVGDMTVLNRKVDSLNNNMFDSLHAANNAVNTRIDTLVSDSLITIQLNGVAVGVFNLNQHRSANVNIRVQQKQKRFVASDNQTVFDLGDGVKVDTNFITQFVVNSLVVGTDKDGDDSVVTVTDSTVTYRPDRNGNTPIYPGDKVQVFYFTRFNN